MLLAAALLFSPGLKDDPAQLLATFTEEFILITPGEGGFPRTYSMGSDREGAPEKPVHEVSLAAPFRIGRFEVPQNLWEAVMGENPSRWKGRRNSVEQVSFDQAADFCLKVTDRLRSAKLIGPHQIVRLPSEAEWEYIARAGTTTRYSFGDDPTSLGEYAWFTQNAAGNDPPVGAKKANPWKLFDVHGYVWEWCQDVWHGSYEGAPRDGSAWTAGGEAGRRVMRGGSWKDSAEQLTSSIRRSEEAKFKDDAVGLRCVLTEPEKNR